MLVGELLEKWVNGYRLKPYKGPMLEKPFKALEENKDQAIHKVVTGETFKVTGKKSNENEVGDLAGLVGVRKSTDIR